MGYMLYIAILVVLPMLTKQDCPSVSWGECDTRGSTKICMGTDTAAILKMVDWSREARHSRNFECYLCTIPTLTSDLLPAKWSELSHVNIHYCMDATPLGLMNDTFINVGNSLTKIWLKRCHISELPRHIFSRTPRLESLILTINKIKEIPQMLFENNINLKLLDLSYNQLSVFNKEILLPTRNLEQLILSHNFITFIESDTFDHMSRFSELELAGNPMFDIDILHFFQLPNMKKLLMEDWPCQTLRNVLKAVHSTYDIETGHIQVKRSYKRIQIASKSLTAFMFWWTKRISELGDITCTAMDSDFRSLKFDQNQVIRMRVDSDELMCGGSTHKSNDQERATVADMLSEYSSRLKMAVEDLNQLTEFSAVNKCYRIPFVPIVDKLDELNRIKDEIQSYSSTVKQKAKSVGYL